MTKVAVYGFVRIAFDLLGSPQWWWSIVVLGVAGPTATIGVLYALMQRDLKRVLAYSTIENIGIIFTGLGLALAFKAEGLDWVAALAFTAALLHVFNHAVFKSLLFFGAGAVLNATGERDMETLGGLIYRMPQTAVAMLVGCVAISALPPFNGFVSEWLTFQAILLSPQLPSWSLKLIVPAVGALLALAAALAAACFVKAFGISFLGRARTPAAASAHETDAWSLAAMFILAALCLIAGTLPGLFIDALTPVSEAMVGRGMPHQSGLEWLTIVPIAESRSSYNGLLVFAFVKLSGSMRPSRSSSGVRPVAARTGLGLRHPDPSPAIRTPPRASRRSPRVQDASSSRTPCEMTLASGGSRTADRQDARREQGEQHPPTETGSRCVTARINVLQFLTIRRYLTLVFVALITLLVVLTL